MTNQKRRELLLIDELKKFIPGLEAIENEYSKWDAVSNNHKMIIEIKCRGDKYKREYRDFLIEREKFQSLLRAAEELGYTAFYVNEHGGDAWSYLLSSDNEPEWEIRNCNSHTHINAMGKERRAKSVGFFKWEDAYRVYENIIPK